MIEILRYFLYPDEHNRKGQRYYVKIPAVKTNITNTVEFMNPFFAELFKEYPNLQKTIAFPIIYKPKYYTQLNIIGADYMYNVSLSPHDIFKYTLVDKRLPPVEIKHYRENKARRKKLLSIINMIYNL